MIDTPNCRPGRRAFARCIGTLLLTTAALSQNGQSQALSRSMPEDVGMSSAALRQIMPRMQRLFVDSSQAPGFVLAIARNGKLAFVDSTGFADIERRIPMGYSTVFRIFSMTKPITSVAIMQLVERGKIALDDPVSKFLPGFARMNVRAAPAPSRDVVAAARPPSIRDLLTHTSGLAYARPLMLRGATIADFGDSLPTQPLLFQPGSAFSYGSSSDLLGRVVEIASGKLFDAYLRDEVFGPLGMRETSFHAEAFHAGRIAVAYPRPANGPIAAPQQPLARQYQPESKLFMGGEGLLSTPPDYLRFAQMLLNGGELDGRRVLKRETVTTMFTNQIPEDFSRYVAAVAPNWIPDGTYGFGFGGAVRLDSPTAPFAAKGTFRWEGALATFFWVDPANDLVVTLWTQCAGACAKERFEKEVESAVYAAIVRR